MPITENRITKLREFGLSEYAARAYLALLDLGLTEARDISTLSKVPTSKIYHILEQLHERGLCIILPEFPKKYAPVPFSEYLDKLQQQHEDAARAIERDRDNLEEVFAVAGDVDVGDRGTFTVLRGRRNVLAKIAEMIRESKREVHFMGTPGTSERLEYYDEDMQIAAERGVRLRFMLPLAKDALEKIQPVTELAEVRDRPLEEEDPGANVAIGIFDNERAIIVSFVPDDGHMYQGKDTAFLTDQESIVAALRGIVEPHWLRASAFETRRAELVEGRLPEFTHVYTTEQDAYAALERALKRETREIAAVRGMDAAPPSERVRQLADLIRARKIRTRAVLHATEPQSVSAYLEVAERDSAFEPRHVDHPLPARFWVLDDREAFVSLTYGVTAGNAGEHQLFVHTSHAVTVRALRTHFEAVWGAARPLKRRDEELRSGEAQPSGGTTFLPPVEDTVEAGRAVVRAAQHALRVVVRGTDLAALSEDSVVLDAAERGVKVRVLTTVTTQNASAARAAAEFADVRHAPRLTLVGSASDGSEAFVVVPGPSRSVRKDGGEGGSWSDDAALVVRSSDPVYVRAFESFFEAQWDLARPVVEHLKDLGEPVDEAAAKRSVPVK